MIVLFCFNVTVPPEIYTYWHTLPYTTLCRADRDQHRPDEQRQERRGAVADIIAAIIEPAAVALRPELHRPVEQGRRAAFGAEAKKGSAPEDRKSTRLNSSH